MIRGGNLSATTTFKKIVSIGYEFETSEIQKMARASAGCGHPPVLHIILLKNTVDILGQEE
jgi:hypothetical protein